MQRSTVDFPNWQAKADAIETGARDDACDPIVRFVSAKLVTRGRGVPAAVARAIHHYVRDRIRYVRDAGGEQLADARAVLLRRFDDCDGKCRLFVALCLAAGLEARTIPIVIDGEFVHVQAEVLLDGAWTLAELTLEGVELGQGIEAARYDAAGEMITR